LWGYTRRRKEESRLFVQRVLTVDQSLSVKDGGKGLSRGLGSYEPGWPGSSYFFRSITIGFCPATHTEHRSRNSHPPSSESTVPGLASDHSFPITPPVRREPRARRGGEKLPIDLPLRIISESKCRDRGGDKSPNLPTGGWSIDRSRFIVATLASGLSLEIPPISTVDT
jgi:hypothetical protein